MLIGTKPTKILIADADPEMQQRLKKLLAEMQSVSICAIVADGKAAQREALNYHPELMLICLDLPELDGFGVIESVQMQDPSYEPNVIVFSNQANEFIINKAHQLGVKYFFLKPINIGTLQKQPDQDDQNFLNDTYLVMIQISQVSHKQVTVNP